ncbi:hypothetical protein CF327_g7086 [Tilletia walkeri]|nr:hypothetical protein CF327_g7086 [Tilletia walkeri]
MIQALRNPVDLWTYFFGELERLLPELLELLCACICQENDTLARIGTSCLQTLVERNVDKLTPQRWEQVVDALVSLFNTTTAHALFDPALRAVAPEPGAPGYAEYQHSLPRGAPQTPAFLRLTHVLEASYALSRAFNADKELRLALWKVGFMKQLPNLLKQESSSAATLVRVFGGGTTGKVSAPTGAGTVAGWRSSSRSARRF